MTLAFSGRPPHESYDDSNDEHAAQPFEHPLEWELPPGPSAPSPWGYHYPQYLEAHNTFARERLLLKCQRTALSEAEFATLKKQYLMLQRKSVDQLLAHQDQSKTRAMLETLGDRLALNRLQRYTYDQYRRAYQFCKEEGSVSASHSPPLTPEGFMEGKRQLLQVQEVLSHAPSQTTDALLKQEEALKNKLFFGYDY